MKNISRVCEMLRASASPEKALASARFFKTAAGQYGEGDRLIGVTVPEIRKVVKASPDLDWEEIDVLLSSEIHEERLTALLMLVRMFSRADAGGKERIYDYYLANTTHINNWDLVDSSAEHIVGAWLQDKDRSVLDGLACSTNLWERRIAMLATFHYIKQGEAKDALRIAALLLNDSHDLIHKAVGWMLREVGKRCSVEEEKAFLRMYYANLPRTTLRYAIELLPVEERLRYLAGNFKS